MLSVLTCAIAFTDMSENNTPSNDLSLDVNEAISTIMTYSVTFATIVTKEKIETSHE